MNKVKNWLLRPYYTYKLKDLTYNFDPPLVIDITDEACLTVTSIDKKAVQLLIITREGTDHITFFLKHLGDEAIKLIYNKINV